MVLRRWSADHSASVVPMPALSGGSNGPIASARKPAPDFKVAESKSVRRQSSLGASSFGGAVAPGAARRLRGDPRSRYPRVGEGRRRESRRLIEMVIAAALLAASLQAPVPRQHFVERGTGRSSPSRGMISRHRSASARYATTRATQSCPPTRSATSTGTTRSGRTCRAAIRNSPAEARPVPPQGTGRRLTAYFGNTTSSPPTWTG